METKKRMYRLSISLEGIRPKIFRTVDVSEDIRLNELHHIIQIIFGWGNYHLYEFYYKGKYYGNPVLMEYNEVTDDKKIKISKLLKKPFDTMEYTYDMGDSWRHAIKVENIHEAGAKVKEPVCIEGARNCPPEDCGGCGGYEALVRAMKQKKGKEYKEFIEWLGDDYRPEYFDLNGINERLENMPAMIKRYEKVLKERE